MKKKQRKEKTFSRLDLNKDTIYQPLYYNGELAHAGDLVKYHNLIDVARKFDHNEDEEIYLLANISEEVVGIKQDTDDPKHPVEDLQWLADIRNNKNSHIVNLNYLVKVKGV
jgi:hypothetical protein